MSWCYWAIVLSKLVKLTQVVIGIIKNSKNEVLLSTRCYKSDFSDCMEFPGGKKQPYESTEMALKRELKEELSIDVKDLLPLDKFFYEYNSFGVELFPFVVINYLGKPVANEREKIIWVDLEDLGKVKIIPGSISIVQALTEEISIGRS